MNATIEVRKSTVDDCCRIMEIIGQAQRALSVQGVDQWQNGYPDTETILTDISSSMSYVADWNGQIVATAVISFDGEPTYDKIYNGAWLNAEPYAVIHRIAVAEDMKGLGVAAAIEVHAVNLCRAQGVGNIRIDTHHDNRQMQRFLDKSGYRRCGEIYLQSGDIRLAYQKVLSDTHQTPSR